MGEVNKQDGARSPSMPVELSLLPPSSSTEKNLALRPPITPQEGTSTRKRLLKALEVQYPMDGSTISEGAPKSKGTCQSGALEETNDTKSRNESKKPKTGNGNAGDDMEFMRKMPSVTTMGEGPNGKRIQGILYKYVKGEEIVIVCICHGQFLSPEEFIRHAGSIDVSNPMKRITLCSSNF